VKNAIPQRKTLETSFVTSNETATLTHAFELALEDLDHVAGGIPAVCGCGCCVPVHKVGTNLHGVT
jgi:hypothetical protein